MIPTQVLESRTQALGRDIFNRSKRHRIQRLLRRLQPSEWFIRLVSQDEATKIKILQYTNTLPSIERNPDKIVRDFFEYFAGGDILPVLRLPARCAAVLYRMTVFRPLVVGLLSRVIVTVVEKVVARRFFAGDCLDGALVIIRKILKSGKRVTVDVLGERSHSKEGTDRIVAEYRKICASGEIDHVSVKLSNLYSEFNPNAEDHTLTIVKSELRKILSAARQHHVAVTLDMEQYVYKELTLKTFMEILSEKESPDLSIALQSYIRDETFNDLEAIIQWSRSHPARRPGVRLVKGANWDFDIALARSRGWPLPLYLNKPETDLEFERCAELLLKNARVVKPFFGTHNIRSIAYVMSLAESLQIAPQDIEFQFLYGMIPREVVQTVVDMGYPVRFYIPYGDLIPGLGYLVRRLLENSSNQSFLKKMRYDPQSVSQLLRSPRELLADGRAPDSRSASSKPVPASIRQQSAHLEELALALLQSAVSDRNPERFQRSAQIVQGFIEGLALRCARAATIQEPPGENNDYFYIPRGPGYVIIDRENASLEDAIERLAGPLAAGCPVVLFVKEESLRKTVKTLLERTRISGRCVRISDPAHAEGPGDMRLSDFEWISFDGPSEKAQVLRQVCYKNLSKQRQVKRFITVLTPDYLMDFLVAKTVSENTLQSGFAPNLSQRGGLEGFENIPEVELYHRTHQIHMQESLKALKNRAVSFATVQDAEEALVTARKRQKAWQATAVQERARFLHKTAARVSDDRFALAARVVAESGKNVHEALQDVNEAIDFLNYYACLALHMDVWDREDCGLRRQTWSRMPYGIAVVIAPWNFPLAILTGMTSAALVMGNTVIMKPAEQTCVVADELMRHFKASGLPEGVLINLPGTGEDIGGYLVRHADTDLVVFTGSREVGFRIMEDAFLEKRGERPGKQVITEMGGKNAIIIDEDADLDEAAQGVMISAFGYGGQKCSACSRVIVLEKVRIDFEAKLRQKMASMIMTYPEDLSCQMGALIDERAVLKVHDYRKEAERVHLPILAQGSKQGSHPDDFFVGPVIYLDAKHDSRLVREEIFGPVLCLTVVKSFEDALRMANQSDFALTGGVYSRTLSHIEQAKRIFLVGNLYINRPITGAKVNQQPFGGYRHSGSGFKTGGPDYLMQFSRWVDLKNP